MLRLLSRRGEVRDRAGGAARADPLRSLAAAALRRDPRAERTLLVALGPALLRVVRAVAGGSPADSEDTLQEAMVAVHTALPGFRGECTVVHFACRVALRTAMNARRRNAYRRRHTPPVSPDDLAELALDPRSPAEAVDAERRRAALRALLDELPAPQAEALALHVVLGYSVDETACATGVPANTVRSRLRAALSALRVRVDTDELRELMREGS
jgi:RNA polymerase sigma-70 factor (ECF subfamily)